MRIPFGLQGWIFFSPSNILHEFFLMDRLVKRHHYKSNNYKGSVKESLKKYINFYPLEGGRDNSLLMGIHTLLYLMVTSTKRTFLKKLCHWLIVR